MRRCDVLVTGGAGFIGSHLCRRLLDRGLDVVALDNFDPFYDPGTKRAGIRDLPDTGRFRLVEADIRDPAGMDAALAAAGVEGAEVVVHLAARAGVRSSIQEPLLYSRVNVEGTVGTLELARRLGCTRFVFGSSSSVYGNADRVPFSEREGQYRPISPYAASKRAGELLCHTYSHLYGLSVVCLRFFTVYGPRQRPDLAIHKFARLMADGQPIPVYGDGSTERDYTYVDDILQGVEGAITYTAAHPGDFEVFNLGESRTTSLRRLVDLLSRALGVVPRIRHLPLQPGDVRRTCADVSRARALLGYAPTTTVEEGIPRFVRWFTESRAPAESAAGAREPAGALVVGALALLLQGCAGAPAAPPSLPTPAPAERVEADGRADELRQQVQERAQALAGSGDYGEARIGPNDVLQIRVFEAEELSGTVRVSGQGEVSLPLLGAVRAADLTAGEFEAVLADRLRERYVRDPHVTVQITELQSRPVSVLGAVRQPGIFQLRGARSLLEVIALAGGLAEDAGPEVVVRRAPGSQRLGGGAGGEDGEVEEVNLRALLESGEAGPDATIFPGDVVSVKRAGMIYVVGEVNRPGAFPLTRSEPLTVLRATALGGGLRPGATRSRIQLVRTSPEGRRDTYVVDLGKVLSGRTADVPLQAEDVVYVPSDGARAFTLGAVDVLVRMVTLRGVF